MESNTGSDPLEVLFARLRETLGDLTPEPLLNRMKPVVQGFLEQFQLVPQREFQAHLANLERLEASVAALEQRLSKLEQHGQNEQHGQTENH
jgi:BMFP domain-containing protein YqiC